MNFIPHTAFRYARTAPVAQNGIVTVAEVRAFSIVDSTDDAALDSDDDDLIQLLINSAVQFWIDYTGVLPIIEPIRATLDTAPICKDVWLKNLPIVDVTKVYGVDTDATEYVADADDYAFDGENGVVSSYDWPSGNKKLGSFNIEYTTGLGVDEAAVPEDVKTAVNMMVTHWFEIRQPFTEKTIREVPFHATAIMNQYKPARI